MQTINSSIVSSHNWLRLLNNQLSSTLENGVLTLHESVGQGTINLAIENRLVQLLSNIIHLIDNLFCTMECSKR